MKAAYPQQTSSPPSISFEPYRDTQRQAPPQFLGALQHNIPLPQPQPQSMPPPMTYNDPYNPQGTPRPQFPDLQPGTQPATADPVPRSMVEGGRKYELKVVQQPRRARMCGFGDKDRRPITPPPCVRLIITDVKTGKEIDCNEIDHSMYVLNVDLWSSDGIREVNLVRHSSTSPSISATIPNSYLSEVPNPTTYSNILPVQREIKHEPGQHTQTQSFAPYPGYPPAAAYQQPQNPSYTSAPPYQQPSYPTATNTFPPYQSQNGYGQSQPLPVYTGATIHAQGNLSSNFDYPRSQQQASAAFDRSYATPDLQITRLPVNNTAPTGMFTRNLIGSLAASAFRLTDPFDHIGIWFVLQDLSVRTEGSFRLRFSFVNVGQSPESCGSSSAIGQAAQVVTTKAPVLAACFSEVFMVYSAKRFPGVVESTNLSKCFATQGIKIPIRKDGPSKPGKNEEYEED